MTIDAGLKTVESGGDQSAQETAGAVTAAGDAGQPEFSTKTPLQIAVRRLAYDKVAMMSLGCVLTFVLLALFAGVINDLRGVDPQKNNADLIAVGGMPIFTASWQYPFGVDTGNGRDLLGRWMLGIRPSLLIAVTAALAVTLIGTTMGLLAGYLGGLVDNVVSFIIDVVQSLPFLLFAIALVPIALNRFGAADGAMTQEEIARVRLGVIIVVLILFGWTGLARLVRGEVISMREREYVQAARALGVPTHQILSKEILPNLLSPIVVSLTTAIPAFITAEAGLSLLGVGLREPSVSWGMTIYQAQNSFMLHPLYMWMPVIGLCLLVLSLSLLGDAVNDAFNPNTRR